MKIYIAGPYSAPTHEGKLANVNKAVATGIALRLRGHEPFIPHLSHYVDEMVQRCGLELGYENYMAWDQAFQDVCEGFYYLGSSSGADRELVHARELGQQIFMSLDEVPLAFGEADASA
jgi:hypothetical protein